MNVYWRCIALLLFASVFWRPCQAKNVAVVVPKSNNTGNISSTELGKFFGAGSRKWADGKSVILVLPGGLGVVDVYSITSTINVLKVDGKLPLEQGYPLR